LFDAGYPSWKPEIASCRLTQAVCLTRQGKEAEARQIGELGQKDLRACPANTSDESLRKEILWHLTKKNNDLEEACRIARTLVDETATAWPASWKLALSLTLLAKQKNDPALTREAVRHLEKTLTLLTSLPASETVNEEDTLTIPEVYFHL